MFSGALGSVITSLAGVVITSAVSSALITDMLPYSFSRASWNSLFFSSLAAVSTLEIRSASFAVAIVIMPVSFSGHLPNTSMDKAVYTPTEEEPEEISGEDESV